MKSGLSDVWTFLLDEKEKSNDVFAFLKNGVSVIDPVSNRAIPWYRTHAAYASYLILLAGVVLRLKKASSGRLRKDNRRLNGIIANCRAEIKQQQEEIETQKGQLERSYKYVKIISQMGQRITASRELEGIAEILYSGMAPLLDFSYLGLGVYNDKTQSIDFNQAYKEGERLPPFSCKLNSDTEIASWSFNQNKEVHINDLAEATADEEAYRSVLCMPLRIKEKTLGVVILKSFRKNAYQACHLDTLCALAAYTAIALDNSYINLKLNELNEELRASQGRLKQMQMQLIHSEKMASLGQLTAGLAHEINNPVNFISAGIGSLITNYNDLSELLKIYSALKPEQDNRQLLTEVAQLKKELELDYLLIEIPQLLSSIKSGAMRTTEIVRSLKNFTRQDEEKLKSANIHEGLDSTLLILRSQLGERVTVEKSYGALPPLQCYPGQLNQVFMNLLSNAIQAIEGKGQIQIKTFLQGEQALISITDNGKGMTEEVKQRIFEPFYTTKDVGEGTGLGLSISYGIIEKHGGKMEVLSTPGKGAEFRIHLPINIK